MTLGATNQGMVAGDLVNTASRLQSVAQPGTVLVGESTQRATSRAIVFEPAGDQTLKGKVAPVPAWRALRVVAQVGGRNRSDTLEAPFVGRADELRMLKDLFHSTEREKRIRPGLLKSSGELPFFASFMSRNSESASKDAHTEYSQGNGKQKGMGYEGQETLIQLL